MGTLKATYEKFGVFTRDFSLRVPYAIPKTSIQVG